MEYKKFSEILLEQLSRKSEWHINADNIKFYKKGFTSDNKKDLEFIRDTNIRYYKSESDTLMGDYIVLQKEWKDISSICRFDMDNLYQSYQKDGWNQVWKIIKENLDLSDLVDSTGVLEQIDNYEAIKERLIIRPLNFTDHRYNLKDCVYKQIGDIALVLYLVIYDDERGLGTTKVSQTAFLLWELDKESVWENALLNTNIIAPPRLYFRPDECYKAAYTKGAFMAFGSNITKIGFSQVPVVTTTKQTNGAIALFYPGVKERLAQLANGSFYVAFTSIHEARIHCKESISPLQILRQLNQVNKVFDPTEILSRKVFYYDCEEGTFEALEL